MGYFSDELKALFENNPFPIFVFCCSNDKKLPTDLKKLFLQTFDVTAPNDIQREQNLKWILEDEKLKVDFDLQKVANKIHGFYFEDIRALVYYAKKKYLEEKGNLKNVVLGEEHFGDAIGKNIVKFLGMFGITISSPEYILGI